MATKIFAVDDLIPAAKEAFLNGAFGFTVAYEIARANPEEQLRLLQLRLAGASRDEIAKAGKTKRAGKKPTARLARTEIALPQAKIVLMAKDLDMARLIQLLSCLLREAEQVSKDFDLPTFVSMMAHRAKKG